MKKCLKCSSDHSGAVTPSADLARALLLCVLVLVQTPVLHAQQGKTPVPKDFPGRWFGSNECSECEDRYNFTVAEGAEFRRQFERIRKGIQENTVFSSLQDIDIEMRPKAITISGYGFDPAIVKGTPRARAEIEYKLLQHAFDKEKGVWVVNAGCSPALTVSFNFPDVLWTVGVDERESEPGRLLASYFIALEEASHPAPGITLCRLPSNGRHILIVAATTRPVFVPVTRGELLNTVKKYYEYNRERMRNKGNGGAMSDFDRKLARLKEIEDKYGDSSNTQAFVNNISQFSEGGESYLCPEGTKGSRAVVRFNPSYFDDSLPRTAIQLVCMRFDYGIGDSEKNIRSFINAKRLKEALRAFDEQSLKGLLDVN